MCDSVFIRDIFMFKVSKVDGMLLSVCISDGCSTNLGSFFFFKQKTAYDLRISDWSSDVCSSDLSRSPARASSCDSSSSAFFLLVKVCPWLTRSADRISAIFMFWGFLVTVCRFASQQRGADSANKKGPAHGGAGPCTAIPLNRPALVFFPVLVVDELPLLHSEERWVGRE